MVVRSTMKPRGFVLIATGLAASVPFAVSVLKMVTGAHPDPKLPPPPCPNTWRRLYRRTKRIAEAWGNGFGIKSESPLAQELSRRDERRSHMMPFPPTRQELSDLVCWAYGDASRAACYGMLMGPEGQFMVRVWLPCVILYRQPPARLLRRARAGDDDAFEALLRLDKSVISDPVLWWRWHAALEDPKPGQRKRFREAIAGRPRKRFNAKTIRIAFAGLLSQLSKREGCEMTSTEIREWFSAFTRHGHLADEAMPGGEALTKAIQRNRNWPAREREAAQVDNKT
jgi:hypothetical protein